MAPQPLGFERSVFEDVRPGAYGTGAQSRAREGLSALLELAADGWRVATRSLDPPKPNPRVVIVFGRDACCIYRDGTMVGQRLRASDAAAIAAAVAAALPPRTRPEEMALGFDDDIALDLELTLPKGTRSALDQAVALYVADESPFAPGEGLAFWSIRRSGPGDAHASIAIVPSRVALAVLDELRALGLEPRHAVRHGQPAAASATPDWLATETAPVSGLFAKFAALPGYARSGLLAVAIVLGSCLANASVTAFQTSLISDQAAAAADSVRREKRLATDVQFLAGRQRDTLVKIRVLDEIAARMPDNAYLERLDIKDDQLELTAIAPSAADTLKAVAAIDGVKSAELQSAVVRDTTRNVERFRLSVTVGAAPAGGRP